jgi:hypothetical protein
MVVAGVVAGVAVLRSLAQPASASPTIRASSSRPQRRRVERIGVMEQGSSSRVVVAGRRPGSWDVTGRPFSLVNRSMDHSLPLLQ